MNRTATLLEDILKVLGASSLILIVVGYADIRLFYSEFNINITNYIDTSEILLLSIDSLGLVLLLLFIHLIIWLALFKYLFDHELDQASDLKEGWGLLFINETISRVTKSRVINTIILVTIVGMVTTVVLTRLTKPSSLLLVLRDFFFINLWVTCFIYVFLVRGTKHFWDKLKTERDFSGKLILTAVVFVAVLVSSLWFKNMMLTSRILKYGHYEKIELVLTNDKTVSSSDSVVYLGKTTNFYFFLNKSSRVTSIYSAFDIKRIDKRFQ